MHSNSSRTSPTTWPQLVRSCIGAALLSFGCWLPSSASADAPISVEITGATEEDVAAILAILQQYNVTATGLATYPRGTGGLNLSRYLWAALFDGVGNDGSPTHAASWLRRIYNAMPTNGVDAATLSADLSDVRYLLGQIGASAGSIESETYDIRDTTLRQLTALNALATYLGTFEYGHGALWDVHLDDYQWSAILNALGDLGATSATNAAQYGEAVQALGGSNDLSDVVVQLRGVVERLDATDDLQDVTVHDTAAESYTDDEIRTNALEELTITPGDAGDLQPVLDILDPQELDVLPSLSGSDPVVTVFGSSGSSRSDSGPALPELRLDFSLPPAFKTFIHAVCVWLWRLLWFLAMWRLVRTEFDFWSTLGGSAT